MQAVDLYQLRVVRLHLSESEFSQLVERESPKLATLVARLIPQRSRVPDLLQELWIAVWQGLPYFRGESQVSTWIWKIAYRIALRERMRQLGRVDTAELLEEVDADPALPPDEALDLKDRMERILATLTPIQRSVVTLFYLQNFSIQEIADIIGQAEGTVKSHLHRARQRMVAVATVE